MTMAAPAPRRNTLIAALLLALAVSAHAAKSDWDPNVLDGLTFDTKIPSPDPPAGCSNTPLMNFVATLVSTVNKRMAAEAQRRAAEDRADKGKGEEVDFVVVGGGAAGCVLANRLSQQAGVKVLLLERGGAEPPQARVPAFFPIMPGTTTAMPHKAVVEPESCNGSGCDLVIPNVLGGGSTLNAMMYVRGNPADYDNWAKLTGDKNWSFDNVLPYFKRAEHNTAPEIAKNTKYHSTTGPLRVSFLPYQNPTLKPLADALKESGLPFRLDVNAEGQLGSTRLQTTTDNGERWSTYRSYLQPALGRKNLRVKTFAKVTRVLLQQTAGKKPRAVGVEYRDAAGQVRQVRAKREVVLSAGAIGTPQVLLLSGIGPADHLKALKIPVVADLPVGQGLMDHPRVSSLEFACKAPLCDVSWASRLKDVDEYKRTRGGPLSESGATQISAFARTGFYAEQDAGQADLQLLFTGATVDDKGTRCQVFDFWRWNRLTLHSAAQHPRSRGSVTLNATDPHGLPVVKLGYFTDDAGYDLDVVVKGLKLGLALEKPLAKLGLQLDRQSLAAPACRKLTFGSDEYLKCLARTTSATLWHWGGTCRMGRAAKASGPPHPRDKKVHGDGEEAPSVVDSRLRVWGIDGLRCADASIMPTLTSGNTNAPSIMIGEKASDIILQDNGLLAAAKQQQKKH